MSLSSSFYAHSTEGGVEEWELLETHLRHVADLAESFAQAFDSGAWGRLAGLWHDLGKYRPEFQSYLRGEGVGVEHAGAGAAMSVSKGAEYGRQLAFIIAGHHSGLANNLTNGNRSVSQSPLERRLQENKRVLVEIDRPIDAAGLHLALPPSHPFYEAVKGPRAERESVFRRREFWTRMLFSALVDADRQATAAFYARFDPTVVLHSHLRYDGVEILRNRLETCLDGISDEAKPTPVNRLRAEVLSACRREANRPPGRFALTVPTGGGKTLSAMSFALNHAAAHGLRRVIVVIPFTSIIEQNAKIYREILDDPAHPERNNVLEHHSNLDQQALREINQPREIRRALAAENWDAPVVVTTTVQFFESLFSNHPSRCRKLHNIAGSVILLDEVQTLPPQFRLPIIEALSELSAHYHCSVVLSTATPPALRKESNRLIGLEDIQEIISDPVALADRARRVQVTWNIQRPTPYDELARQMAGERQVLAIVHRRQDARELAEQLPPEGRFHLSALMCPAHRLSIIAQIHKALQKGRLCRVCATQLVEAGVDLDFPVVYRALAGIDSLAQAAGRCDREGRLTAANDGQPAGRFIIFRAPTAPPPGTLRKALESTEVLLDFSGGRLDLFNPDVYENFFDEFYNKIEPDAAHIQSERQQMNFANTAAAFRLIQNDYLRPVVVPYQDALVNGPKRIDQFRKEPNYLNRRALQPLTVQINQQHHEYLQRVGAIESLDEGVDVPTALFGNRYNDEFGLVVDPESAIDPELFMA